MGFLVLALVVLAIGVGLLGGLVLGDRYEDSAATRLKERGQLKVIHGQLAALQSALRIETAEHTARRRMQDELNAQDVFANSTIHEEPELWR